MTTFQSSIRINSNPEDVWAIIKDLSGVKKFSPGVSDAFYITDKREGLGAARRCVLLPMGEVDEEVLAWDEGRGYTVSVVPGKGAPPIKDASGSLRIEPAATAGDRDRMLPFMRAAPGSFRLARSPHRP